MFLLYTQKDGGVKVCLFFILGKYRLCYFAIYVIFMLFLSQFHVIVFIVDTVFRGTETTWV